MVKKVIGTDVLIVGGGAGGMIAAIEASKLGVDVLLVSKGLVGKSGDSVFGAYIVRGMPFSSADSAEGILKEIVKQENYFLLDQEMWKGLLTDMQDCVRYLEEYGIFLPRNPDGSLLQYKAGELNAVSCAKIGETGKSLVDVLRCEVLRRRIDILEEAAVTSLLTQEQEVVGATALDFVNGSFIVIEAKAVILATGPGGYLWSNHSETKEQTGDGLVLAYRAGAELIGIEQHSFISVMKRPWRLIKYNEIHPTEWVDSKGEPFDVLLDGNSASHVMTIHNGAKKGRCSLGGGYYYRYKDIDPKNLESILYEFRYFKKLGMNPYKDWIECQVAPHHMAGGLRISPQTKTNVPGLYCAGGIAGLFYPNWGLKTCIILGKRSAKYAAERALSIGKPSLDWLQVRREDKRVTSFIRKKQAQSDKVIPAQVKEMIRKIMDKRMHFIKTGTGMKTALKEIRNIRTNILPKMQLSSDTKNYNYDWVEALDVVNMLDLCELIIKASLLRKESRGMFQREDYPEIDNKNWLKNIVIKLEGGRTRIYTEPPVLTYYKLEDDKRSPEEKSRYIPCVWKE